MKQWIGSGILLVALALAAVWQRHELASVSQALAHAHLFPVLLAALCQFGFFAATIWGYTYAFNAVGAPTRWRQVLPVWFTSLVLNLVTPGGGMLAFVRDAVRRDIAPARTVSALLIVRVCDLATFTLLLSGGFAVLGMQGALHWAEWLAAGGLLLLIGAWSSGLILARVSPNGLARLLQPIERFSRGRLASGWARDQADRAAESVSFLLTDPKRLIKPLLAALLAHLSDLACLWALTYGFGRGAAPGAVLAAYAVGMLFWIVTITPDGLGTVEAMMTVALASQGVPVSIAAAVTLSFRGLSLWLPLLIGAVISLARTHPLRAVAPGEIGVRVLALLTGIMGLVNVVSAVQPGLGNRLVVLRPLLPLELRHNSHLAAGFAGFALLLLAQGLFRRKQMAFRLTVAALALSVVAHLAKGLDWEEAGFALLLLVALWRLRHRFVALSDGPTVQQGIRVLVGAFGFTLVYGVTGYYLLDRHFSQDFGFRAALVQTIGMFCEFGDSNAFPVTRFGAWFADSVYLIAIFTFTFALFAFLRPVFLRQRATEADRERALSIVTAHGRSSLARFVLFSDKLYWFSVGGSVIGYALIGRNVVALGDPIGPESDIAVAIREFVAFCRQNDWVTAFYQTLPDHLDAYRTAGMQTLCIGSEAVVDVQRFTLAGGEMKNLRGHVGRVVKAGYTTKVLYGPHAPEVLQRLRVISDEWCREQHGGEKRFSLGWFDEAYLNDGPLMVVCDGAGQIVAFANIIPEYRRNESTIDLVRRSRDAAPNVMDLMYTALFAWAKEKGFDTFNLGLAPLSLVGQKADDQLVERVLHLVYRRANRFYSYEGLYAYKRKFHPEWEPRYLVYTGAVQLPHSFSTVVRANNPQFRLLSARELVHQVRQLRPATR